MVFQPAEEGGGGAKQMVDAGILEGVDAIFGLHVSSLYPVGTVAIRSGPILAGSGFFDALISGKGGHAAIPQNTIDPILAASSIIVSLQHLVSREADPLDSQVFFLYLSHDYIEFRNTEIQTCKATQFYKVLPYAILLTKL